MNDNTKKISPPIIIAILFQVIFMVAIGFSIYEIIKKPASGNNYISIDNYSMILDIKNEQNQLDIPEKGSIENTLYNLVFMNNLSSVPNNGAKIREGSIYDVYIEELKARSLNFIIDLDSLQQSYRVAYILTGEDSERDLRMNDSPVIAFCLDKDELIYDDFNCKDDYNGHGKDLIMQRLLQDKNFEKLTVGVPEDLDNGESLSISIFTISDDETAKNEAVSEISAFISSVGFDLEDFEYTINPQDRY